MPVLQWELGFTPKTFNLIVETGINGERIAREKAEKEANQAQANAAQSKFLEALSEHCRRV